jgi:PTH1 family peptidyl-tRNA hydrolase
LVVKIIVGLGNPGRQYAATRHNLGFLVVDEIARRYFSSLSEQRKRFRAELMSVTVEGEKIVLVKPQTYMNLSGLSVREAAHWYKVRPAQVLVVADDIDLPFGTLRMRASGSSGGHNGFKSVFAELGTQDVPRLRIGVGRGRGEAISQVLARFTAQEEKILPEVVRAAADCALTWQREGIVVAMNRCNRRILPESEEPVATVADSPA